MNDVFVVQRVWQMRASGATTVAAQLCLRLSPLNLNDTRMGTRWGRKARPETPEYNRQNFLWSLLNTFMWKISIHVLKFKSNCCTLWALCATVVMLIYIHHYLFCSICLVYSFFPPFALHLLNVKYSSQI